jgi:hypothetical protein
MGWRWAFMGMDSWYSLEGKFAGEKVMVIVRRNKTWRDDATHTGHSFLRLMWTCEDAKDQNAGRKD